MSEDKIKEFEKLQKKTIKKLSEIDKLLNLNMIEINRNRFELISTRNEILLNSKILGHIKTKIDEIKIKLDHQITPSIWTPFKDWLSPKEDETWKDLQEDKKDLKEKFKEKFKNEKEGSN